MDEKIEPKSFEDENYIMRMVDPRELIPYRNNSKKHSDEVVLELADSMLGIGFGRSVSVDQDMTILAGHKSVRAAIKNIERGHKSYEAIPVLIPKKLTDIQRRAFIIAENRQNEKSEWDFDVLSLELEDLQGLDFDIGLTGFDDSFILGGDDSTEGLTGDDEVPDSPENPVSVLGDVWIMGEHRLMCGDSTSIDAVDKLLSGIVPDLAHCDPPYGISEPCDRASRTSLAKGNKFENIKGDDSIQTAIDAYALCEGIGIKRQVWWGGNYYAHHLPQTGNWMVWDKRVEDKQKNSNSDCELAWVKSNWSSVRIFRHLWKGMIKASEHGEGRVHPTQKPVALVEWVFEYYKDIKSVMDLFGGSGSTLMAAEKRGVNAYIMEYSANYCDVIINRWQNFTDKKATLESTGETFEEVKTKRTVVES